MNDTDNLLALPKQATSAKTSAKPWSFKLKVQMTIFFMMLSAIPLSLAYMIGSTAYEHYVVTHPHFKVGDCVEVRQNNPIVGEFEQAEPATYRYWKIREIGQSHYLLWEYRVDYRGLLEASKSIKEFQDLENSQSFRRDWERATLSKRCPGS